MATPFHTLPPCLFVELLEHLDVSSLGTLRLVNRSLKALFDPPFLHPFRDGPIDLSKAGLGIMRCLDATFGIRDLTLTCVVYQLPSSYTNRPPRNYMLVDQFRMPRWKERAEAEEKRRRPLDFSIEADKLWMEKRVAEQREFSGESMCAMLTTALRELRDLRSITLTARVVGPDRRNARLPEDFRHFDLDWRELRSQSVQSYRILVSAIAKSRVCIEGLYIYQGVKLCGVPENEASLPIERTEEAEGLSVVLGHLKSFAIRLTSSVDPIQPRDIAVSSRYHDPFKIESNPEGLAELLHLMPHLESLDLHFFTNACEKPVEACYKAFLPTAIRGLRSPNLKELSLAGFWTTEESTRRTIKDHPSIQTLSLRHLRLADGSWEPIFVALGRAKSLRRLYLLDLRSPGVYMLQEFNDACMDIGTAYATRNQEYFPGLDNVSLWETQTIGKEDLGRGLELPRTEGPWGVASRGMASREGWVWSVYLTVEVGPFK